MIQPSIDEDGDDGAGQSTQRTTITSITEDEIKSTRVRIEVSTH